MSNLAKGALIMALAMLAGLCVFAQAEDVTTIYVWSDNAHEKATLYLKTGVWQ